MPISAGQVFHSNDSYAAIAAVSLVKVWVCYEPIAVHQVERALGWRAAKECIYM